MMELLKAAGVAAAIMAVPVAASAATVRLDPTDSGSTYDLLADDYGFAEVFGLGTPGATLTYSFENTSDRLAALTIVGGSVLQVGASFADGISFMVGDQMFDYAEGQSDTFGTSLTVAAGETVDLVLSFGQVVDNASVAGKGSATATFTVEAAVVPVPAAGLLLLTAMGGLALARRRKSA
ncbi:VPLPA-CTERM sorting domain-containing protein [Rubellimicrobium roseum]|uniref:VPLPA-CTERM sorting domain-containing protein n=1 Tax=Rubellimicrobium roseum TaxID=687525 RepID=A0A5C4NBZ3_9RHOB|nr:VPLPA-CTERM sorting domain-containing protein [Rubellimicrobium roseum]TNC71400.1 VPLPA-CTERM sorting domain-containing protein [Rubellimicrobium roseum]